MWRCWAGDSSDIHTRSDKWPARPTKKMRISPGEKGTGDLWIAINVFMLLLIRINNRQTCKCPPPSPTIIKVHQIMIFFYCFVLTSFSLARKIEAPALSLGITSHWPGILCDCKILIFATAPVLPPSLLFIVAGDPCHCEWVGKYVPRVCWYKYTVIGLTLLRNFAGAAAEYINSSIYPI